MFCSFSGKESNTQSIVLQRIGDMTPKPGGEFRVNRRQVLATLGMSAVAGCSSTGQNEPTADLDTTNRQPTKKEQTDCIERSQYEQLRSQYEDLQTQFEALKSQFEYAQVPPYTSTGRQSVMVTYETLAGDIDSWQWASSTLSVQNTAGNFIREMTYSQLEYMGWDVFGFKGNSKYRQLGDYGWYYQLNPFVVPSNFSPLSEELANRHESDKEKIRAAWSFVTQLNEYVSEIEETPRYPLETLLMGGGDCEDSAILLASLLYSIPTDFGVTFWYIDANNPTNPQNINHVILGADTESGPLFIETTSNEMTPYDEVQGFSVEIEPTHIFGQ